MPFNTQKIPVVQGISRMVLRETENREQRTPRCMPCSVVSVSGAIVTVKFEVRSGGTTLPHVTMPVLSPEYIRWPIQVGDKGMSVPCDYYLGQMSGLGDGVADLRHHSNLGTLAFMPTGNKHWTAVDGNALVMYAPNGVVLRDSQSKVTFTLTPAGIVIDLHTNGVISVLNGDLHVQGAVIAGFGGPDQVNVQTHHGHVSTGGAPTPGT